MMLCSQLDMPKSRKKTRLNMPPQCAAKLLMELRRTYIYPKIAVSYSDGRKRVDLFCAGNPIWCDIVCESRIVEMNVFQKRDKYLNLPSDVTFFYPFQSVDIHTMLHRRGREHRCDNFNTSFSSWERKVCSTKDLPRGLWLRLRCETWEDARYFRVHEKRVPTRRSRQDISWHWCFHYQASKILTKR
jgi:hypothetical protein